MKGLILFFFLFIFSIGIHSQNLNHNSIYNANEIIYYGWDFSQVRIFDPRLVGKENEVKSKIGVILGNLSSVHTAEKLAKDVKKTIIPNFNDIQNEYSKRDISTLITYSKYKIKNDDIKFIIENYKLNENSGLGFVIIPESMNSPEEYSSTLFVFFDIKTRILISKITVNNSISGGKFTNYWLKSFSNSYKLWLKDYKAELKKFKKSN